MGGGTRLRLRRGGFAALLLCALHGPACAASVVTQEGRYVHPRRGYRIDAPPGEWSRVDVQGADLAFRGPDRAAMSLMSRCGRPVTELPFLGRHLLIGLSERKLLYEGEVELGGRRAWTQRYEASLEGARVQLKFVTLVHERCVYDWALVSPRDLEAVESSFDAWWASFHLAEATPPETTP
jgi:hypothetical protein